MQTGVNRKRIMMINDNYYVDYNADYNVDLG